MFPQHLSAVQQQQISNKHPSLALINFPYYSHSLTHALSHHIELCERFLSSFIYPSSILKQAQRLLRNISKQAKNGW